MSEFIRYRAAASQLKAAGGGRTKVTRIMFKLVSVDSIILKVGRMLHGQMVVGQSLPRQFPNHT